MRQLKTCSRLVVLMLVAWTGALSGQATAASNALVVTAENVTAKNRGAAADAAVLPGDVVRYQLRFTNPNQGDVRGVVFTNPVPQGLRYVDGSAGADRQDVVVEYSIDGGKTYSARPMVSEVVAGKRVQKPAAAEQYSHVRWTVRGSIAPGASVTAEFRATLPAAQHKDSSSH
ncbi:MAG TPA: hypothetical protein VH439_05670 [Gemmatimonadales bacterium]|jgi:uncharacterized repeat protein (TIGR01451 family)